MAIVNRPTAVSEAGNDKVQIVLTLDGDWRPNHKQYHGAPVFQHLALTKGNAPQVQNFLDAIGATSKDLMEKSIVDENKYITKLGDIGDPKGILVYVTTARKKMTSEYPNPALEVVYGGYLPVDDDDSGDAAGQVDGDEPPF